MHREDGNTAGEAVEAWVEPTMDIYTRRTRVYVAGKFSDNNVLDLLKNIAVGTKAGVEVFKAGYAPFIPWLDHQIQFYMDHSAAPEDIPKVQDYYETSLAFMFACDCCLFIENWKDSKGALEEHRLALEHGIPIYYSLADLIAGQPKERTRNYVKF